jgi:hypothetical protein
MCAKASRCSDVAVMARNGEVMDGVDRETMHQRLLLIHIFIFAPTEICG